MNTHDYLLAKKCTNLECETFIHTTKNTCNECGTALEPFYDYFSLFNLPPFFQFVSDTQFLEALKKEYKLLSLKFHPDINSSINAERNFSLIQTGFQALSQTESRDKYLEHLEIFEDLYEHDEILYEDTSVEQGNHPSEEELNQSTTKDAESHAEQKQTQSTIKKLNILTGLFLAVIIFGIFSYFQQPLFVSLGGSFVMVALSISTNFFFKGVLILVEVAAISVVSFIIATGHFTIASICAFLLFLYFYKVKKSLNRLIPFSKI